ncbi:MAG TPA: response regulator transcription factor [Burkholderiaceae bacterium]|nr:response regulator transcription factor [Burkholderiaceae bacterium]
MNDQHKARIMIVDDHPIVRHGIAQLLNGQTDMEVVAEAEDAESAMRQLRDQTFELLIVDISMPGLSGLDLIRRIKAKDAHLPILVLSMHDESVYAERALAAGARGFLMKHEATDKLVSAVRKLLGGGVYLSRALEERMFQTFVGGQVVDEPLKRLTEREFEVLQLIAQGLTSAQIAKRINRSIKSVEAYRTAIRSKLGAKSTVDLARLALEYFPTAPR